MNTPTKSIISALLAVPWYCALLIPPETRNELLGGNGRSPARLALLMVLTSLVVSLPLWWLLRRRRPVGVWALAAITPVAIALAFSSFVYVADTLDYLARTDNPRGPVAAFFDQIEGLVLVYCIGVPVQAEVALEQAYYVAFPMGLLHVGAIAFLSNRKAEAP
jgi:hypothetical protein